MSSSLVWEGKKECERKIWGFVLKKKLTLQDWITMFSFFVLLFLLNAALFWGGKFHSSNMVTRLSSIVLENFKWK